MSRHLWIACAFLLAFAAGTAVAETFTKRAEAEYAVFNQAFNRGDAKAVAALYSPDALLLPATHAVIKKDGIEAFFAGLFANGVTDHTLEIINVIDSGDTHVVAAKWTAKGKDAAGKPASFGGVATHVFQKQADGSYKLRLHTFN